MSDVEYQFTIKQKVKVKGGNDAVGEVADRFVAGGSAPDKPDICYRVVFIDDKGERSAGHYTQDQLEAADAK